MLEKDLLNLCRKRLESIGVIVIKNHGSIFSLKGLADLSIILQGGKAGFIEIKRDKKCKLTPVQEAFLARVGHIGALTWVIKSQEDIDELINFIKVIHSYPTSSNNNGL